MAIRRKCTFAGVGKSREEIEYALEQGVYSFNVESEAELEYIDRIAGAKNMRAPIALRVNPDVDPHTHEYISTGSRENKFGIALDRVAAVYERAAKMRNIEIVGVQMHIGSQIAEAKPFASAIKKVAPIVRELKSKYGIKFFSIGGGMGIIYQRALESGSGKWWHDHGSESSAFSVRDYAEAIVPPLRELEHSDPGRAWSFSCRQRWRFADPGALHQTNRREEIRDCRCRHERPDSAGALSELSRDRAGCRSV